MEEQHNPVHFEIVLGGNEYMYDFVQTVGTYDINEDCEIKLCWVYNHIRGKVATTTPELSTCTFNRL